MLVALSCGCGRHLGWLNMYGFGMLLDLSEPSLPHGKQEDRISTPHLHLHQQMTPRGTAHFSNACISSVECPWAVTRCLLSCCGNLGRWRGTFLPLPQHARAAQLPFVPFTFFQLTSGLEAERIRHHAWTKVLRFLEELSLSKAVLSSSLTSSRRGVSALEPTSLT